MRKLFVVLALLCLPALGQKVSLGAILAGYVHEGKVDYEGLTADRRPQLRSFADSLSGADLESLSKDEKIAFWLDAYNGLVILQVVETGRQPATARERAKFFRGTRYDIAGKTMTLDQVEHEALRPLADDPRVHFVLVCGANSCPPLQASSFLDSGNLDFRLEQATRAFINAPSQVQLDTSTRVLRLSSLFDWYKSDFGDVLQFVARYRDQADQAALAEGKWKIEYIDYDWSLNKATPNHKP